MADNLNNATADTASHSIGPKVTVLNIRWLSGGRKAGIINSTERAVVSSKKRLLKIFPENIELLSERMLKAISIASTQRVAKMNVRI